MESKVDIKDSKEVKLTGKINFELIIKNNSPGIWMGSVEEATVPA